MKQKSFARLSLIPTADGGKLDRRRAEADQGACAAEFTLRKSKPTGSLAGLALVRSPRLSVMPVTADEYRAILALSQG